MTASFYFGTMDCMAEGIPQPRENTAETDNANQENTPRQEGFSRFFRHPSFDGSRENTTNYNRFFRHPFGGRTPEQEQAFAQYLQETAKTKVSKEKSRWLGQAGLAAGLAVGGLLLGELKLLKWIGSKVFDSPMVKKFMSESTPFDLDTYFKAHAAAASWGHAKK